MNEKKQKQHYQNYKSSDIENVKKKKKEHWRDMLNKFRKIRQSWKYIRIKRLSENRKGN